MNITSFLVYCFIVTFTPGPTNIVILSIVHKNGIKKAMDYIYGAIIAFCLLLVISSLFNSILASVVPRILLIMKMIGSLFMLYLAYQACKMDSAYEKINDTATFMSGFFMQFLNPKIVLFTLTVIPTYIMPYDHSTIANIISVMVVTIIGFLAFLTWVLFGSLFKEFMERHQKMTHMLTALFLVYSAVMLWI